MAQTVDVVILTWNDQADMRAAVASALASAGVEVSVIVVDNGSDPPVAAPSPPTRAAPVPSAAPVPPLPAPVEPARLAVLRNPANLGVAAGRNRGVRAGSAPFVCLLDSDARLEPDCLSRLLRPLEDDPAVAVAAPVFTGQAPEASAGGAPRLARKLARAAGATAAYRPMGDRSAPWWDVDVAIGACQLVRRRAFDEVGGLDESFFYGPEDVDFCLRLRRQGWRTVQVRDAACEHSPRRSNRAVLSRRGVAHAWAVGRFLWRHRRWPRSGRR